MGEYNPPISSVRKNEHTAQSTIESLVNCLGSRHDRPSTVQIASLCSFQEACATRCVELSAEESSIENQILHLQHSQQTLIDEQDQLMKQLDMCAAASAPIRRIPAKLLAMVFFHCLPDQYPPTPDAPPLLFLQVCQFWREVAISQPQLWTELAIFSNTPGKCAGYIEGTRPNHPYSFSLYRTFSEQWLQRAGTLALSLDFRPPSRLRKHAEELKSLVTSTLIPASRRCHTLRLSIISPSSFDPFLTLPPTHLEQLESLTLEGNSRCVDALVFSAPPRLKRLSLSHVRFSPLQVPGASRPFFTFPWPQLTELNILDDISIDTWTSVLRNCRNLQHGKFRLNQSILNSTRRLGPPIALPQLHFLDIEMADNCSTSLCGFTFPSLTYLCLRYFCQPRLHHRHGISMPHMPCLESLCLVGNKSMNPIELLKSAPSTLELQIIGCPLFPSPSPTLKLLDSLIDGLLPKLRKISLEASALSEPTAKLLSKLAISRGPNTTSPLQDVIVHVYNIRERQRDKMEQAFATAGNNLCLKQLEDSKLVWGSKKIWLCKRCTADSN